VKSESYRKTAVRFKAQIAGAEDDTLVRLLNFLEACDHGLLLVKDVQRIAERILFELTPKEKDYE
jgi:hypothetical protein